MVCWGSPISVFSGLRTPRPHQRGPVFGIPFETTLSFAYEVCAELIGIRVPLKKWSYDHFLIELCHANNLFVNIEVYTRGNTSDKSIVANMHLSFHRCMNTGFTGTCHVSSQPLSISRRREGLEPVLYGDQVPFSATFARSVEAGVALDLPMGTPYQHVNVVLQKLVEYS